MKIFATLMLLVQTSHITAQQTEQFTQEVLEFCSAVGEACNALYCRDKNEAGRSFTAEWEHSDLRKAGDALKESIREALDQGSLKAIQDLLSGVVTSDNRGINIKAAQKLLDNTSALEENLMQHISNERLLKQVLEALSEYRVHLWTRHFIDNFITEHRSMGTKDLFNLTKQGGWLQKFLIKNGDFDAIMITLHEIRGWEEVDYRGTLEQKGWGHSRILVEKNAITFGDSYGNPTLLTQANFEEFKRLYRDDTYYPVEVKFLPSKAVVGEGGDGI